MKQALRPVGVAVLLALVAPPGCQPDGDQAPPDSMVRVVPARLSDSAAWALFDRSLTSAYSPTAEPVAITFEHPAALRALAVYGSAPFLVHATGFSDIDLSRAGDGWHVFPSIAETALGTVELRFERIGAGGTVPELELWERADDASVFPSDPITVTAGPDAEVRITEPAASVVAPAECTSFTATLDQPGGAFRRAFLVYSASGIPGAFALERTVNGIGHHGGAWLPGDGATHTLTDELDPSLLQLGANTIQLCLPDGAAAPITVSNLRVVGQLDRGDHQAVSAELGDGGRDASALLDNDTSTTVEIAAGQQLDLGFERLLAPDAVWLTGAPPSGDIVVECRAPSGATTLLAATTESTPTGAVVVIDSGTAACAGMTLRFSAAAELSDVDVHASSAGEPVDWPRLVVTGTSEHFGDRAWVGGFVARPRVMLGAMRVTVSGHKADSLDGEFGALIERSPSSGDAWPVTVSARLPDGTQLTRQLVLDHDARATTARGNASSSSPVAPPPIVDDRFGHVGERVSGHAAPGTPTTVQLGTRILARIPAGALAKPTDITIQHLTDSALPPLDPGMVNVTAPSGHGYEFLPHGQHFARAIEVVVPYDLRLIPRDYAESDVHTFYFDTTAQRWKQLDRVAVDTGERTVHSSTDHFTVMVDAVLAVPKDPTPRSFDPTALSSIGAASPAANIDLIEPPQATSSGDAMTSLPIRVPQGRGAYTPALAISYASSRANGWLGVGWDLAMPRVEIDTRWGVPTYGPTEEPRYLLDGAELVPTTDSDGPTCQSGTTSKRYHTRIEGAFAHILRCDRGGRRFHFEVHDRDGTLYVYGPDTAGNPGNSALFDPQDPSLDDPQHIFRWQLLRVVDVHGNTASFVYTPFLDHGGEPSTELYPSTISYSGHPDNGPYAIDFITDDSARPDLVISGRAGFKTKMLGLLRAVRVRFHDQVIREYVLTYAHGQFDKSVLSSIQVYGAGGCTPVLPAFSPPSCSSPGALFDTHSFDYFHEDQALDAAATWAVQGDPEPDNATLSRGGTNASSFGASLSAADGSFSVGANHASSRRDEFVGLYDVDGDGLPDQVFAGTDSNGAPAFEVLYNQSATVNPAALFAEGSATLVGLPGLGIDSQSTWSADIGLGFLGAGNASAGFASSAARARQFVTDLDGDGFIDLVRGDGTALLGKPCPNGLCFTSHEYGVGSSVDPRNDTLLQGFEGDIKGRLTMADPVVRWVAPFDGTVHVSGSAIKVHAGGTDGVSIEAYHQDDLLDGETLAPGATDLITFPAATTLDVTAGDSIYLRLRTGSDDGIQPDSTLADQVDANFTVEYSRACTAVGCTDVIDPFAAHDPSGAPVFAYNSQADFRLAGSPVALAIPAGGNLEVHAVLAKQPAAADVRACVQLFTSVQTLADQHLDRPCSENDADVANVSGTFVLPAGAAVAQPIDLSLAVDIGQLVIVRVESDFSFDPEAIALQPASAGQPIAFYDQVCLPTTTSPPVLECTTDPTTIATVPLSLAGFGPFVHTSGRPPAVPFVADQQAQLHVADIPVPGEPFVFAVRSDEQGTLFSQDCTQTSCGTTISVPALSTSIGESLSFEIVTASGSASASSVVVSYPASPDESVPLAVSSLTARPDATPFGGGYRGVEAAFWNEGILFQPTQLLSDLADPGSLSTDRKQQIIQSIIAPGARFAGTTITGNAPAWIAPTSAAFVSATALNAGYLTLLDDGQPAGDAGGLYANGYTRLSGTKSVFVSASIGSSLVNLGITGTESTTDTTTDVVDMNGDGVADVLSPAGVRLGAMTSSPAGGGSTAFDAAGPFRHRDSFEYAVGFGGNAVVRETRSGGWTTDVESVSENSGGLGLSANAGVGVGRTATTRDLVDLNGDGLPDIVTRQGSDIDVRYNLGTHFGSAEPFGHVDDALRTTQDGLETTIEQPLGIDSTSNALGHETTITTDESGGFNFVVVSCSHSSRQTSTRVTRQLVDINGDGLPDLLFKTSTDSQIHVQLNRGGDFGPATTWSTTGGWPFDLDAVFDNGLQSALAKVPVTGADVLSGGGSLNSGSTGCSLSIPIVPGVLSIGLSDSELAEHRYVRPRAARHRRRRRRGPGVAAGPARRPAACVRPAQPRHRQGEPVAGYPPAARQHRGSRLHAQRQHPGDAAQPVRADQRQRGRRRRPLERRLPEPRSRHDDRVRGWRLRPRRARALRLRHGHDHACGRGDRRGRLRHAELRAARAAGARDRVATARITCCTRGR